MVYYPLKQAPPSAGARFEFIFSRYFIERTCESAKFLISLSILLRNNQQGDHSVFVSCWAFLCRYRIGLLAEPTRSRMGKRPAFLFFGHGLVCRITTAEAVRNVRLPRQLSSLYSRNIQCSADTMRPHITGRPDVSFVCNTKL